jgi:hypothetical protein
MEAWRYREVELRQASPLLADFVAKVGCGRYGLLLMKAVTG